MGIHKLVGQAEASVLECKGASLSDLFETAAQGIFRAQYDTSTVGFERELLITAEAEDLQSLLEVWLSQLLTLIAAEDFVPGDFMVVEIGEPPMRRHGPTRMIVRAVARGRMRGDWFAGVEAVAELSGPPEIATKRKTFLARIPLKLRKSAG